MYHRSLASPDVVVSALLLWEDTEPEAPQAEAHADQHCEYIFSKQIPHGAQLVTARMSWQGAGKVRLHHQGVVQLCIGQNRTKGSTI